MNKLDGIKPGDRVRVTFEGRVLDNDGYSGDTMGVALDGSHAGECVLFPLRQQNAPTFQIERIEPPLSFGDKIVTTQPSHCYGEVVAVNGDKAWVFWEHNRQNAIIGLSGIKRA